MYQIKSRLTTESCMSDEHYRIFSFTSKTIIANHSFEIWQKRRRLYKKKKTLSFYCM